MSEAKPVDEKDPRIAELERDFDVLATALEKTLDALRGKNGPKQPEQKVRRAVMIILTARKEAGLYYVDDEDHDE